MNNTTQTKKMENKKIEAEYLDKMEKVKEKTDKKERN